MALNKAVFTVDIAEQIIKKMNSAEHKREQSCNGTLLVSTTPSLSLFKNSEPEWFLVDVWIFDFGRHYLR
ncbi:rpoE leader peptide RseD [Klebsiella sp. BIGb0407]|uniref:rpoE leader peptide RseD n=1 Tax=Klebsiella sp. BIGb0407 TaxID=2940603 RepID=UPI0038F74FC6